MLAISKMKILNELHLGILKVVIITSQMKITASHRGLILIGPEAITCDVMCDIF